MTTTDEELDATVQAPLHYTVAADAGPDGEAVQTQDASRFPFTLGRPEDDDVPLEEREILWAHRPKTAIMMKLAVIDPDKLDTDVSLLINITNTFIDHALEKPSREYLRARFEDPDDNWDVDMLIPIINVCKTRWFGSRPTGRATGSSGSPKSRGKRSKAR